MNQTETFPTGWGPNEFGEIESQIFVVEPDDAEGTTVRAWLLLLAGGSQPLVMLEAEDRSSRNRRALLPDLARGMVEVLAALSRLRTADPGHQHPGWCAQLENASEPHRSHELVASIPSDGEVARARLVHGERHLTRHPATFIEIDTIDQTLAWPPLTSAQHDALIGKLTLLLDLMHLGGLLPVDVRPERGLKE